MVGPAGLNGQRVGPLGLFTPSGSVNLAPLVKSEKQPIEVFRNPFSRRIEATLVIDACQRVILQRQVEVTCTVVRLRPECDKVAAIPFPIVDTICVVGSLGVH